VGVQQARLAGVRDRLQPACGLQLAEDVVQVRLDGATSDVERLGDLAVDRPAANCANTSSSRRLSGSIGSLAVGSGGWGLAAAWRASPALAGLAATVAAGA
jgi:hypothetical protein